MLPEAGLASRRMYPRVMTRCELLAETLPIDISTYVRVSEVDEFHWCHTTRKNIRPWCWRGWGAFSRTGASGGRGC